MALSDVTLNSPFDLQSKPKEKFFVEFGIRS